MTIRPANDGDKDKIWEIFRSVVTAGDAFVFEASTSREEAFAYWFGPRAWAYVAEADGRIVGSYMFRPNQPGRGSHVANAAFMVSPDARGLGVGKKMGEHCLNEARRVGFKAMQFNIVVSTNTSAVRLWKQLGFAIVGTLPEAFRHAHLGFVDAYVMFKKLD
ncbi:MAG TPA: GNAT family N-acetyltransferase [Methylomirabilota bacterium]|nr:GNAT family N-acetyltransferase [Methylomirabilota bacterium]